MILFLANIISSSSNVLYVAVTENMKKLDIGGICASLLELVNSSSLQMRIKEEYIKQQFSNLVLHERQEN